MKKEKSSQIKQRNNFIFSQLKNTNTDRFDIEVKELAKKYHIGTKQVYRIHSKLNTHPTIDRLGNVIGKDHWKIHTKSWWVSDKVEDPEITSSEPESIEHDEVNK